MKKRILAMIMSMLLIACTLLTFASCVDNGEPDGEGGKPDIDWLDNLGDHDLDGYTVKFAVAEAAEDDGFNERSIVANSNTGDRVDSAIHARNENIKRRFNCNIELAFVDNVSLSSTTVKNVLMSEGDDYDILAARQYDDVVLCSEGLILDIAADSRANKYISIGREYWGGGYVKGMTYNKQCYWLAGDLNLRYTGGFYATFVNAKIYDENFLNDPNYGHIHDIVNSGKWTVDKLQTLSDAATHITGTAVAGQIADGDVIGVAFPIHDNTNGLAVSCGVKFSKTNADGSIAFNFKSSNSTLTSYYKEYMELINSKGCLDYYQTAPNGGYEGAFKDFASDKALFVFGRINQAELYLRKMTNGFYIVPNPKLNENQKQYISSLHDAISIYGINPHSEDIEASAIVLEALAAESYRSVRPEYYDRALKSKYTTDKGTKDMINLISENAYSDFVLVWAFTTYFKGDTANLGAFLRAAMRDGEADITTRLNMQGTKWDKNAMDDIAEAFAKMEEKK